MSENQLPPPYLPLPLKIANGVGRLAMRLGWKGFTFDEGEVLEAACAETGLRDFGGESFRPGLGRLIQSLEEDARLTPFGRFFARKQLVEALAHRLRMIEWRNRHPQVAGERIERPLFVLGLPRTGTTLLYSLLARDPAHRAPLSWEVDSPNPPPTAEGYDTDPRIEEVGRRMAQLHSLAPDFNSIHPVGEMLPQECIAMTALEFMSLRFEMTFNVAGYQRWLAHQDMAQTYRFHRHFLQHLQSGGRRGRWVLKSPGHLGPIAALLGEYPDAMIVQTHRDPLRVIPSVSSLEYTMRAVSSDDVVPEEIGAQMLWLWSTMLDQGMRERGAHERAIAEHEGEGGRSPFLDLHFQEIISDPMACVDRIYDYFGLELSSEARSGMERYLKEKPTADHGPHSYSLEGFGLSAERVEETFKRYCEHFGVAPEPYT